MTTNAAAELPEVDYDLADAIELAMERDHDRADWSPSELGRKVGADAIDVRRVLDWMLAERYVSQNGRGGSWRRFGLDAHRRAMAAHRCQRADHNHNA